MKEHVLVIYPHPDDEAFSCSGTMALHIEKNVPVTYVCLTLGEMGRNMGNPPFTNRQHLPQIRKEELLNSCKAIGITDLRMLGMHDKTVEFEDDEQLTTEFLNIINEVNPTLVITFYPGYCVHPDHEATARAVVRALERIPAENRPTLYGMAFAHNSVAELGKPDVHIDVSSVIDKKLNCIKSHESQLSGFENLIPDLREKLKTRHPDLVSRVQTEHFWTYKWDDNQN